MEQKLYDIKKLQEISMGNETFVQKMLVTFVENVAIDIELVKTHRSAENWNAVAERAHKLASNFAYLNATDLQQMASSLEKSVIHEGDLTGIAEKADELYNVTVSLIEQLKLDFNFLCIN